MDIIPEIGRRWKLVAVHVLGGEVTKPRPADGWTCLMISCKAARMGALPVRGWEVPSHT